MAPTGCFAKVDTLKMHLSYYVSNFHFTPGGYGIFKNGYQELRCKRLNDDYSVANGAILPLNYIYLLQILDMMIILFLHLVKIPGF